jgi:hypothetical protein
MNGEDSVFPILERNWNQDREEEVYELSGGVTKRELFAAMAMQGSMACAAQPRLIKSVVEDSVKLADALMAELAKVKS